MLRRWVHTSTSQQLVVGPGALSALGEILRALGARRVLLVTTRGRAAADGGDRVRAALGRALVASFDQVDAAVPASTVQAGVRVLHADPVDAVVSFGGGAAIDTAKAIAFFHEHGSGTPAAGFADRPVLPHLAIPTTLVGAAYSPTFSMLDPQTRRSTTAGAPTLNPSAVVIDPELVADLPGALLAGSVAAALGHGVEALWAPDRTPETEAVAAGGLRRLAAAGPGAGSDSADIEQLGELIDGAVLCGRSRQGAPDGLHHVVVQLVAARAGVPYGAVHAALLPITTRFTVELAPESGRAIATALGSAAEDPAEAIGSLLGQLGPRRGLAELGVDDEALDAVARQAGSHRGVQLHPRPVGEGDLRALLDDAC